MLCNRFRKELDDEDGFEEVLFCCRLLVPVLELVPVRPVVREEEEVLDEEDLDERLMNVIGVSPKTSSDTSSTESNEEEEFIGEDEMSEFDDEEEDDLGEEEDEEEN